MQMESGWRMIYCEGREWEGTVTESTDIQRAATGAGVQLY